MNTSRGSISCPYQIHRDRDAALFIRLKIEPRGWRMGNRGNRTERGCSMVCNVSLLGNSIRDRMKRANLSKARPPTRPARSNRSSTNCCRICCPLQGVSVGEIVSVTLCLRVLCERIISSLFLLLPNYNQVRFSYIKFVANQTSHLSDPEMCFK